MSFQPSLCFRRVSASSNFVLVHLGRYLQNRKPVSLKTSLQCYLVLNELSL